MAKKERILCPIRMYEDEYIKVREKALEDGITYQKLIEVLVRSYMKDDMSIRKIVLNYVNQIKKGTTSGMIDQDEASEILRMLEEKSPLNAQR